MILVCPAPTAVSAGLSCWRVCPGGTGDDALPGQASNTMCDKDEDSVLISQRNCEKDVTAWVAGWRVGGVMITVDFVTKTTAYHTGRWGAIE